MLHHGLDGFRIRPRLARWAACLIVACVTSPVRACDPTDPNWGGASATPGAGSAPVWERGGSAWSPLQSVSVSNYDSDCNPWLTADENEIFFIRYSLPIPSWIGFSCATRLPGRRWPVSRSSTRPAAASAV